MRKLLTTLFLILIAGGTFAQPTPEELQEALKEASTREKFAAANDLFFQKKYYHALTIFLNLLEEEPDNAHFNYKTGICYLNSNIERTKALKYLVKCKDGISKNYDPYSHRENKCPMDAYYYLGQAYHLDYQFDKAIDMFSHFKDKANKKHILQNKADLHITQCKLGKKQVVEPKEDMRIENLGSVINSRYSDFSPVLSLDGNVLYFTSTRLRKDSSNLDDYNWETGNHFEDIYVSYRDRNGEWQEPRVLGISEVDRNEATIGVSADGMELFIYQDDAGDGNIYYSAYGDTSFNDLEYMGSDINSGDWETHASISPDGNLLFFVSDRPGGFGGRDIYFVRKLPNGFWGKAQNAGPTINSEFDEDSPFVAADGKTLYFSSNGPKSIGGFDIFVTRTKDVSEEQLARQLEWEEPANMGYPLNTVDDDVFFIMSADGVTGYYSSLHDEKNDGSGKDVGFGEKDIYKVTFENEILKHVAILKGYIVPKEGEPVPSNFEIYAHNLTTGETTGPYVPRKDDGGYALVLKPCHSYRVEYLLDGNLFSETEFDVPCEADIQTIHREIYLDPLAMEEDTLSTEGMIRWRVVDSPMDLVGRTVNYYDEDEEVKGSVTINGEGIFEYENMGHDFRYEFLIDGLPEIICKEVCVALIDNEGNTIGYAVRKHQCRFTYEKMETKWQLVDNAGNPVNQDNVKIIFKDKDGNTSFEEKLGCEGMFAYHPLNPDNTMLFELEGGDDGLCDEVKIILLDKNNKVVGETVRDNRCQFVYGERDIEIEPVGDDLTANYEKYYKYNQKDIKLDERNFKSFIDKCEKIVQANGVVKIDISSSASKVPTTTFKTNENLAKKRAQDAKARIVQALKKRGVSESDIKFTAISSLVLGPNYRNDFISNKSTYEKYQYVKVKAK